MSLILIPSPDLRAAQNAQNTADTAYGAALAAQSTADTAYGVAMAAQSTANAAVTPDGTQQLRNKELIGAIIGTAAPTSSALASDAALSGDLLFHWLYNQQYAEMFWGQDGGNVTAGSGNVTGNVGSLNLITGSTAGSSAVVFSNPVLRATDSSAGNGQKINWSKTVIISATAYSGSPLTTNATLRFCFGTLNSNPTALDARGVGIVCTRATASTMDVKLETHNGTSLTTSATLATVNMSVGTNHRFTIVSSGGTAYLFIDGTYAGSSSGAPTTMGGNGVYHKVMLLNGSDSANSIFQVVGLRIFVKP